MSKEKIERVRELTKGNEVIIEGVLYRKVVGGIEILNDIRFMTLEELNYLYYHDTICYILYNCTIVQLYSNCTIELKVDSINIMYQEKKGVWYKEVFY